MSTGGTPSGHAGGSSPRTILHVDLDAFYATVEQRDDPALRGRPVVVGGAGARGVVAAASYEARAWGVHSAMPSTRARRLCPSAVFVAGDHGRYAAESARVFAVFRSFTPLVEGVSLDEAFLDVTGARRLFGDGEAIAHTVRERVGAEVGLPCSVGVASTKLVAKLASEAAKPTPSPTGAVPGPGVVVVRPGDELAFLHPLPVGALRGVGPRTLARLERLAVRTVGDLATLPVEALVSAVGDAHGRQLHALARGVDPARVVADRVPRSIGHEETFAVDHHDAAGLQRELVRLTDAVATRLRARGLAGRTVHLKVRYGDFRTLTRAATTGQPARTTPELLAVAARLLAAVDVAPGVRLLGVAVSGLVAGAGRQLSFGERAGDTAGGWDDAAEAVDRIRARFGPDAIAPVRLADGGGALRVKRPGDTQWGPPARR